MKEFKIWCDACGKEMKGEYKVNVKNNITGTETDFDLCKDCFDKIKGIFNLKEDQDTWERSSLRDSYECS